MRGWSPEVLVQDPYGLCQNLVLHLDLEHQTPLELNKYLVLEESINQ